MTSSYLTLPSLVSESNFNDASVKHKLFFLGKSASQLIRYSEPTPITLDSIYIVSVTISMHKGDKANFSALIATSTQKKSRQPSAPF
jgi:hypothetical protein